jgi:hypothetical protein
MPRPAHCPRYPSTLGSFLLALAACSHPVAKPPVPASKAIVATGAYWNVLSGLKQPDGSVAHILATKNVSADGVSSDIDLVSTTGAHEPLTLTAHATADPLSLRVSAAAPEALLYLDGVSLSSGLGTLMYADLSVEHPIARPVPGASNVIGGGGFFGPTGAEVLFFANFDETTGTAHVYWSHGSTDPIDVGFAGDFATLLLSRDRRFAFLGVNTTALQGTGDLIRVDLSTGATTFVAAGVILRANAYGAIDSRYQGAPDLAFSATPDGRHVVFGTPGKAVHLWSDDGSLTTISNDGRFPAISTDGREVGLYTADSFVVWVQGAVVATSPATGALPALFSPDGRYVAFLREYTQRGQNGLYGSALGSVEVIDILVHLPAIPWGTNVAWHSVAFGPSTGTTRQVSLLANCRDLGGTPTLDGAIADFYAGTPSVLPARALARSIDPYLQSLPVSGGWAFMAADPPFTPSPAYVASVWRPSDAAPVALSAQALNQSLQTGGQIPTLTAAPDPHGDEILFFSKGTDPSFDVRGVDLWGSSVGGAPFKIRDHVLAAALANDGQVVVVQAVANSSTDATVQLLPFGP